MNYLTIKNYLRKGLPGACLLILSLHVVHAQSRAWENANRMGRSINLSWLEYYKPGMSPEAYLNNAVKVLPERKKQIQLMHDLGFKTIRLPVTFDHWASREKPYRLRSDYFRIIDSILLWTGQFGLNLIIDNHHGSLDDSLNLEKEIPRLVETWKQIADYYKDTDPGRIYFELYNEPHDISRAQWMKVLSAVLPEVRRIVPEHTLIIGGADWNSITGLVKMGKLPDDNVIYTFHFYDPFLFTHQGAVWAREAATSNIHIPFPYAEKTMPGINPRSLHTYGESNYKRYPLEGNALFMRKTLEKVRNFSKEWTVPVFCGEFGSYKKYVDPESRARYTGTVIRLFEELKIPYAYWEWDGSFSFFNGIPAPEHIPEKMKEVWDF